MSETLEKLTILEIGAGSDYKRALKTAKEHPKWHVIAIDPAISWHAKSPSPNLEVISGCFPHEAITKRKNVVDRVEMYHLGTPFMYKDDNTLYPKFIYSWLNNDNPWLAEKHEIWIVDNNVTDLYHNSKNFTDSLNRFKNLFEKTGYKLELEEIPKEKYELISDWDKMYVRTWPSHVKIKLIKN